MRKRTKKLIGTCLTLIFVGVYALIAMTIAQTDGIRHLNGVLQGIFFGIVGLAWILPLMPLIRWMERDDTSSRSTT